MPTPMNSGQRRGYGRTLIAAIDDATEAIRLDPGRVEAFVGRAVAYNGLGEWSNRAVDLDKVVKRNPDWSWNWFERDRVLWTR